MIEVALAPMSEVMLHQSLQLQNVRREGCAGLPCSNLHGEGSSAVHRHIGDVVGSFVGSAVVVVPPAYL